MKILFTGGGSGGHFYPIIAVARAMKAIAEQEKIVEMKITFMSDDPYDEKLLQKEKITFKKIPAGKVRRYFSLLNFIDVIKTGIGVIKTTFSIYFDFPDIIFSKGGYASFPVTFAAKILRIPLIIHESDSVPGKVNSWSSKHAKRIAISFVETNKYFPEEKTALTGNPIRKEFFTPSKISAKEFIGIDEGTPVLLVMGGSLGAQRINEILVDALPELLKKYQVIHQCGKDNLEKVKGRTSIVLENSEFKSRYHLFGYLNESALRMSYASADLVVSRAGSGSIFEIAATGIPSILIPLPNSAQNHQHENAYAYAKTGATNVMEEPNLTEHLLQSEISAILDNPEKLKKMSLSAKEFSKADAAEKIARGIINLVLEHAS